MIEIRDVTYAYGDHPVLDGVTLTVAEGTVVGLIGPNGAGKTTLLRLIDGFLEPDAGRILVDGQDLSRLDSRAASRRVAVVPQETRLSFDFPVREVVAMGRHPHRSRLERTSENDRERVEAALRATGTAHLTDRPFTELSGGERKRVLIARALAQDATNLLFDEPTASLDINHQVEVFGLVADLRSDDHAVLAAIHDLGLAGRYCDQLALLHDGGIAAVGPPEAVLDPTTLERAYDVRTGVVPNPLTDTPLVVADPPAGTAVTKESGSASDR